MRLRRRDAIAGAGALALGTGSMARAAQAKWRTAVPDDYFLSPRNPLATTDQRHLDALALELWARPDVQQARDVARAAFARVTDQTVSAEMVAMLPDYADSFAFRSIQIAVNSDADHPRIYRTYTPAARFLGNDLPAARWGSENPDNIYRIVPIGFGRRYVLHGQVQDNPPADVSYVLVADTNTSITEGLLGQDDLEVAADGSFTITLDETPAEGRANHIQVTPEAKYLFIRDSLNDWMQTPNALRVERLGQPASEPLGIDALAARAARIMQLGVAPAYYWNQLVVNGPANSLSQPHGTGPSGGLLTQQSSHGWFTLEEGDAAIVNCTAIEADYQSIVIYDRWGRSREYRDHLTSLNGAQSAPDADGSYTYVIAARDPGVHNWLDTQGLSEVMTGIRWQGIAPGVTEPPQVSVSVVKLDALDGALRAGVRKVSVEERAAQMAQRRAAHDRRYIED